MIIHDPTVQERYAGALLNVAKRQDARQQLLEEAAEFVKVIKMAPTMLIKLEAPQFTTESKIAFLDRTIKGKFHPVIERLVYLLLEKRRIDYLSDILTRFVTLLENDLGIKAGIVTTAVEMDEGQKALLQKKLEAYVSGRLTLTYVVDPSILGGVRFRCGDLLLDDTVAWRLESLSRTLQQAARRVDAA